MVILIVYVRLLVRQIAFVQWWKCSLVLQDKEQGKNIVVVGSWNANEHTEWATKNVARSYQLKDNGVQKVK